MVTQHRTTPGSITTSNNTTINLPNPPTTHHVPDPGHAAQMAEQSAIRDANGGSYQASTLDSLGGPLPAEEAIAATANGEKKSISQEKAKTDAIEAQIEAGIITGQSSPPTDDTDLRTLPVIKEQCDDAEGAKQQAIDDHTHLLDVLNGKTTYRDGSTRTGAPIAQGTTRIRWAIVLHRLQLWAILAVPMIAEAIAVYQTMKSYLRLDDNNFLAPASISTGAILILALFPVILGRYLNDVRHGAETLSWKHTAFYGAATVIWICTGFALALTRVSVDRDNAIRAAHDRQQASATVADGFGISPSTVTPNTDVDFPYFFSIFFWAVLLLGMGIIVACWEYSHWNPARIEELKLRAAVEAATKNYLKVRDRLAAIEATLAAQKVGYEAVKTAWDHYADVIDAATAGNIAIYKKVLAEKSNDPDMPVAIEDHARRVAAASSEPETPVAPVKRSVPVTMRVADGPAA